MIIPFQELVKSGISKDNIKSDLISFFESLKEAEAHAEKLYDDILENNNLKPALKKLITNIRDDERSHVKYAEKLKNIIRHYDFNMELLIFKL